MWKNGFATDNLDVAEKQKQAFQKGDIKGYLALNYLEDRPLALKFLLQHGIRDRFYWEYAYAYGTGNFHEYIPLLPHFSENVSIAVKPLKSGLVRIYRGINVNSASREAAFSWTTSKQVAHNFANLKTKRGATVLQGLVNPKDILAHIKLRKENELIINPNSVQIEKEIKLYPPITERELNTFNKRAKASGVEAFLTYGILKERLKTYKAYLPHLQDLNKLKQDLTRVYGDFLNVSDQHFSAILRKAVTTIPLTEHKVDTNLMSALRHVDAVLNHKTSASNYTILTRYLLHGIQTKRSDEKVY